MNRLASIFFDVLVNHNHEIVMSGAWLEVLAIELAEQVYWNCEFCTQANIYTNSQCARCGKKHL